MLADTHESVDHNDGDQGKETQKASLAHPVALSERINSIDVLRGVAVLGILAINIDFFALPSSVIFDPTVAGGFAGLNLLTWKFSSFLFYEKMMAIFSMLFGAGLILMYNRAKESGLKFRGKYYRRLGWLFIIGMIHAYLLWYGDILVPYALSGLLMYLFRRRSPRLLIILGVLFLSVGILIQLGSGFSFGMMQEASVAVEEAYAVGETPTPQQVGMSRAWDEIGAVFNPSPEEVAAEVEAYRGGFVEVLKHRFPETLMMQTQAWLFMVFWRVTGLMLIGMALMKLGVFSAKRSVAFYTVCVVVGYGVGLPLVGYGLGSLMENNFEIIYRFSTGNHYNYVGSILVAMGHISVVMILCKRGWLTGLTRRLAAVGRMALSNYLTQTIVCTTIFYGYGFGMFGRIDRFGLLCIALAIWLLQLIISPIWLKHFLFGPAEWLWRSLTYWRRQPMKVGRLSSQ